MKNVSIGDELKDALKNTSLDTVSKFFDGIRIIYRENNSKEIHQIIINDGKTDYVVENREGFLEIYANGKYSEWSMANPCSYGLFVICRETNITLKTTKHAKILNINSIRITD